MSFQELAVVFVIGLLVLGPERLPAAARQAARWIGRARRTANDLRHLIEREVGALDRWSEDHADGQAKKPRSRDVKRNAE